MIKIKPIIICASVAFVLSFLTALIVKTGIPFSLLKAVIFAIVFGGIAVGVQVVYEKFLSEGEASAAEVVQTQKPIGGKIDIVVSEEDLPDDKEAPSFFVDSKRHILTATDVGIKSGGSKTSVAAAAQPQTVSAAAPVAEKNASPTPVAQETATAEKSAFVAVDLGAKQGVAGTAELASAAPAAAVAPQPQKARGPLDDELPELDEFPGSFGDSNDEKKEGVKDDEVIEDSDFAEEGSPSPSRQTEFPDGKVADSKDAELMAKAIQTVLKKEE